MMWQDLIFSIGSIIFIIALIPTIIYGLKPPKLTSLPTALVLTLYSFTLYSLDLYWSAGLNLLTAILWYIIFIQSWRLDKYDTIS